MKKGELDYAHRKAMEVFDAWNDVVGFVEPNTSYYYEIESVIEEIGMIFGRMFQGILMLDLYVIQICMIILLVKI